MSCIATSECFAASRCTQCTVGELSLNRATWASCTRQTSSITSHNMRRPAISRSELVMVPVGLASEIMLSVMSCGHWSRNTIGATARRSPMMTPPSPCPEASVMPTKSGHPVTRLRHFVGELTVSRRKVRQSATALRRFVLVCK